jgi:hypothetical protein
VAAEPLHDLGSRPGGDLRAPSGRATEVDISFAGDASATTVTITHRGWERLGTDAPAWRHHNLGGWSGLLPHYQQAAGS